VLRSARILRLPQEEETDAHFEPVIKLTEQVETKTNEEEEESTFKMYVLLYPYDARICTW
jgi:Ran-binding protein 1